MHTPRAIPFSAPAARPLLLSGALPLAAMLAVLAAALPLVAWLGLANPNLVPGVFALRWDGTGAWLLALGMASALFFVPLAWMLALRRGDFAALWLMQNALLAGGFFFLPATAGLLNHPALSPAIVQTGPLVVIINAVGYLALLVTLALAYGFARAARAGVGAPPAPPAVLDARLALVLRAAGVYNLGAIALAMAVTHTIPMLAADPVRARDIFDDSPATRPLYNAGMALLPCVTGGLFVLFLRHPRRLLGLDGALAGAIFLAQLLSGNRFALATAAMVTIALVSMEKKLSRGLLLAAVMGFLLLFVGLSGLTSLWRTSATPAASGDSILVSSFRQAYLGNNLIDYRDAAWVFSQWDRQPLLGKTYLGGLAEMLPSAVFPQKKQWHLGQVALHIVGWWDEKHFGLRLSCFGESFLNFGYVGVVAAGVIMGIGLGTLLRYQHLLSAQPPCLARNLRVVMLMQMILIWTNSADAFMFWTLLVLLVIIQVVVFYRRPPVRTPAPYPNWVRTS